MLEFICFFMPSFISIVIYHYLNKTIIDMKRVVIEYGVFNTINNVVVLSFVCIKHFNEPFGFDSINISFCFKYLLFALVVSLVSPLIVKIIKENIKVGIEVRKNEKTKKSK